MPRSPAWRSSTTSRRERRIIRTASWTVVGVPVGSFGCWTIVSAFGGNAGRPARSQIGRELERARDKHRRHPEPGGMAGNRQISRREEDQILRVPVGAKDGHDQVVDPGADRDPVGRH